MRIALIDNGIDRSLVDCKEEIDFSQGDIGRRIEYEKYNHGTVCAGIITKYAPESSIISLKAVDKASDSCGVLQIKKAIEYCVAKEIRLISMSLGTRNMVDIAQLYNVIDLAIKANITIVAPGSRNLKVYPAAFSGVIYVDINDTVIGRDASSYIESCPNGLKAFIASGVQEVMFKNGEIFRTPNYSSFAVPVIASMLHNYMAAGHNTEEAVNLLRRQSGCL